MTTTHPKLTTETVAPVTVTGYNVVHGPAEGTVDWTSRQDGAGKVISYSKNTYLVDPGVQWELEIGKRGPERVADGTNPG